MNNIKIKLDAHSHQPEMKLIVIGPIKGLVVDNSLIDYWLKLRRPSQSFNTSRVEDDQYRLIGLSEENVIVDDYLEIIVENNNTNSHHYPAGLIRPGHADYVGYNYFPQWDYRGGGNFSGRITVLYVILGAIIANNVNFKVWGKISQIGEIIDPISIVDQNEDTLNFINPFNASSDKVSNQMIEYLNKISKQGDSIGALATIMVTGAGFGLGGPDFANLEGRISQSMFAIGGIKGISFGVGNDFYLKSTAELGEKLDVDENQNIRSNNISGGINGGISNGYEPIIFNLTIKGPSSIFKPIKTIQLNNNMYENTIIEMKGRHDSFIANRVLVVAIMMTYICIFDSYLDKD